MERVVLITGGNIGDGEMTLRRAAEMIEKRIGRVVIKSQVYKSKPWGVVEGAERAVGMAGAGRMKGMAGAGGMKEAVGDFVNQVVVVDTELTPEELLDETQTIEKKLGRVRENRESEKSGDFGKCGGFGKRERVYQSRVIDIDILFYGERIITTERLTIPHPMIEKREFVLVPLVEILPLLMHPISGKTAKEMLNEVLVESRSK